MDNEILYWRLMAWAGIAVALFACHTMSGWKKLVDKIHKTSRGCLDVANGWREVAEHYKDKYARMVDTFGELPGDESEEL